MLIDLAGMLLRSSNKRSALDCPPELEMLYGVASRHDTVMTTELEAHEIHKGDQVLLKEDGHGPCVWGTVIATTEHKVDGQQFQIDLDSHVRRQEPRYRNSWKFTKATQIIASHFHVFQLDPTLVPSEDNPRGRGARPTRASYIYVCVREIKSQAADKFENSAGALLRSKVYCPICSVLDGY